MALFIVNVGFYLKQAYFGAKKPQNSGSCPSDLIPNENILKVNMPLCLSYGLNSNDI